MTIRCQEAGAGVATAKCCVCGAARMGDGDLQTCAYCGSSLF